MSDPDAPASRLFHASTVALRDRAVLILGAAGSGKSTLALELMALGLALVADDRTLVTARGGRAIASAPPALLGLIEARGVGILRAVPRREARVVCAVNLDHTEAERLPERRGITLCGCDVPLLHNSGRPGFAAALVQYLKAGRSA